jgi:putative transposase
MRRHRWLCHAYCLMTTHYHVVLETTEATLSAGMHVLNGCYARTFNRRHGTKGHVFDARFGSRLVSSQSHLLDAVRYVALNPVRAGLSETPQAWPWSSYATLLGDFEPLAGIVDRRRTLALLDDGPRPLEAVRRFVED